MYTYIIMLLYKYTHIYIYTQKHAPYYILEFRCILLYCLIVVLIVAYC